MKPTNRKQSDYELDERAAEATFVLNHALVKEAFDAMRGQYIEQMAAALTGTADMLDAHAKLRVLADFQAHFRSIVTNKQIADKKGVKYG